jgi:hypothetical protein
MSQGCHTFSSGESVIYNDHMHVGGLAVMNLVLLRDVNIVLQSTDRCLLECLDSTRRRNFLINI